MPCIMLKLMTVNVRPDCAVFSLPRGKAVKTGPAHATRVATPRAVIRIFRDKAHPMEAANVAIARYGRARVSSDGVAHRRGLTYPP